MGCLCSKGTSSSNRHICSNNSHIDKDSNKSSPQQSSKVGNESIRSRQSLRVDDDQQKTVIVERPSSKSYGSHKRKGIEDSTRNNGSHQQKIMNKIISLPFGNQGEQIVAGWPSWLSSVAGEAIQGWVPRRGDSFDKLDKIGQGTYSSVYRAHDLETGKIVAMKKVRFLSMDPESVRFMAREILILRKLDHPNIMKLEGLVTSRMSGSLYLVFEYMEHDLAGLLATPGIKFTQPQIKWYMQQLLEGLEHCHNRGVLHRDIKGSNLLINNEGELKIGDFGLATLFKPDQKQPLTSRVVTLWYRPPELLLGITNYGVAVDMWSVGCILAELFVGKPIMPGRTEVEQIHKIFKLCGSPSENYWKKTKFAHATSFKPQQPYKRRLNETFKDFPPPALSLLNSLLSIEPEKRGNASTALKTEFFTTSPLPCDPSSLPIYPPSKEFDIKLREEEAKRKKAETMKGRGAESVRKGERNSNQISEFDANAEINSQRQKGGRNRRNMGMTLQNIENGLPLCTSMVHPSSSSSSSSSWNRKPKEDDSHHISERTSNSLRTLTNSSTSQKSLLHSSTKENMPKKNRMHYSGPLVPVGGNLEDMLKEHERQIQQAVRKSRLEIAQ